MILPGRRKNSLRAIRPTSLRPHGDDGACVDWGISGWRGVFVEEEEEGIVCVVWCLG